MKGRGVWHRQGVSKVCHYYGVPVREGSLFPSVCCWRPRNEGVPDKVLLFTEGMVLGLNLEGCVGVQQEGIRQNGGRESPTSTAVSFQQFCKGLKYS